jgi:predicted transcriptional regulator
MKVIDLLNKIANGEEVPKKIKWGIDEWQYNNGASKNYFNDYEDLFSVIDGSNLNDKVEIIEDKPKHIEELANVWGKEGNLSVDAGVNLMDKINELSKAVNYLLDKEGK